MNLLPPLSLRECLIADLTALGIRLSEAHPGDPIARQGARMGSVLSWFLSPAEAPSGADARELLPATAGLHAQTFGSPDESVRRVFATAAADLLIAHSLLGPVVVEAVKAGGGADAVSV